MRETARQLALLEELRQRQIEALAERLSGRNGADNGPAAGTHIAQLSDAIEMLEKKIYRARDRRFAAAAVLATLALVGTLLFLPLFSTAVSVETKSENLSFTLVQSSRLFGASARAIAAHLASIGEVFQGNSRMPAFGGRLDLYPAASKTGQIGLDSLELPAGTRVGLYPTGAAGEIGMTLLFPPGTPPPLDVDVEGEFQAAAQNRAPLKFADQTRLEVLPRGNSPKLSFGFAGPEVSFAAPIEATRIAWNSASLAAPSESTIISGKVTLEEISETPVALRPGEPLRLGDGPMTIRQWKAAGVAFTCQFDGEASEFHTGEGIRRKNRMPTFLAWLRGQSSLAQFWALFGSLATLALAVHRFWRKPE